MDSVKRTILLFFLFLVAVERSYGKRKDQVCGTKWKIHGCNGMAGRWHEICRVPQISDIIHAEVHQLSGHAECNYVPAPWGNPPPANAFRWEGVNIIMTEDCRANFNVTYLDCEDAKGDCHVYGDPHFQTFDNKQYLFGGTCSYMLATHGDLEIIGAFEWCRRPHISCLTEVTIKYNGMVFVLGQGGTVTDDNGNPVTPPAGVMIEVHGHFIRVLLDNGVTVTFDGQRSSHIFVSDSWKHSLSGMCGDYNGNPNNDHTDDRYEIPGSCSA